MRIKLVVAAAILASGSAPAAPARSGWTMVELTAIGRATLAVEANSESGASPRLTVRWRDKTAVRLAPAGGLVPVAQGLRWAKGEPESLVRSDWVYAPTDRFLIAFGHGFESDPGPLYVVRIGQHGRPSLALSEELFELAAVATVGPEIRLIGHRSLPQYSGSCLATYDPFAVLVIGPAGRARYSEPLSRAYNESHYYWAGSQPREDLRIDTCQTPVLPVYLPQRPTT